MCHTVASAGAWVSEGGGWRWWAVQNWGSRWRAGYRWDEQAGAGALEVGDARLAPRDDEVRYRGDRCDPDDRSRGPALPISVSAPPPMRRRPTDPHLRSDMGHRPTRTDPLAQNPTALRGVLHASLNRRREVQRPSSRPRPNRGGPMPTRATPPRDRRRPAPWPPPEMAATSAAAATIRPLSS